MALLTAAALGFAGVRPLHCSEAPSVERSAAAVAAPAAQAGGAHAAHGGAPARGDGGSEAGEGTDATGLDGGPEHAGHDDERHGTRVCLVLPTCGTPALPEVPLGADSEPVVRQAAAAAVAPEPSLHDLSTDPPPPRHLPPGERS